VPIPKKKGKEWMNDWKNERKKVWMKKWKNGSMNERKKERKQRRKTRSYKLSNRCSDSTPRFEKQIHACLIARCEQSTTINNHCILLRRVITESWTSWIIVSLHLLCVYMDEAVGICLPPYKPFNPLPNVLSSSNVCYTTHSSFQFASKNGASNVCMHS